VGRVEMERDEERERGLEREKEWGKVKEEMEKII